MDEDKSEASRKRAWREAQKKLQGRSPLRANSRTCEQDPRSVKQLKHFCRRNHLSTSGNRENLVERVADFEASTPCAAAANHLHVSDSNAPPAARAALWSVEHLLPPSVRSPGCTTRTPYPVAAVSDYMRACPGCVSQSTTYARP